MAMRAQITISTTGRARTPTALRQNQGYYSEGSDELQSGTLSAGGSVAGNIYFDGDIKKALYFANMFDKSATASWVLA